MKREGSEKSRLLREGKSLLTSITSMSALYPLRPVWPGLASFVPNWGIAEPPEASDEEKEIDALHEPLTQFLKDLQRFANDCGTPEEKGRFRDNGLVVVAFQGGKTERSRYAKQDCLADLGSLMALVRGMGCDEHPKSRSELATGLRAARRAAGHSQQKAAGEIDIDVKAFPQYEQGKREPRKNRAKLMTYIRKYSH
ncbi:MAG TPA: helix-turn-helix transcriptional regulator [Alphaproteobacteria bacterium]|nr:helix-turn-helix transcriptional regulator [Alphaproteobacteria bacterium]